MAKYADDMSKSDAARQVAARVETAITTAGKSIRSLSDEIGIPYVTLRRKVRGQTEFLFSELLKIAEALDIPAWSFIPARFQKPEQEVQKP